MGKGTNITEYWLTPESHCLSLDPSSTPARETYHGWVDLLDT
jgi:hypothetical protein